MLVNTKIVFYKNNQPISGTRTIAVVPALYNTIGRSERVLYTGMDAGPVLEMW